MPDRRQRRDVARNRERLLATAEDYFGKRSLDAPLQGLAKEAGLGEATLFRHFPSHEALVRALYDRVVERIDLVVARATATEDPWLAVEVFLRGCIQIVVDSPAVPEIMRRQAANDPSYTPGDAWAEPIRALVDRAVAAGVLRPDVRGADLVTSAQMFWGIARVPERGREVRAHRHLQLLLDGLRANPAHGILPLTPLNADEVHERLHGVGDTPDGD